MKLVDHRKKRIREVRATIKKLRIDQPVLGTNAKEIGELSEELFLLRNNKHGSRKYEFTANAFPNRRQRRNGIKS